MDQTESQVTTMDDPSSEAIKREITETRRGIDETIDEIGERLHPRHLLDDVIDVVRSRFSGEETGRTGATVSRTTKRLGKTLSAQLREHPVPALLVGAGVTWWIWDAATDDEDEDAWYADADDGPEGFYADTQSGAMSPGPRARAGEESSESIGERAKEKAADAGARIGAAGSAASSKIAEAGAAMSERMASAGSAVQGAAASGWGAARRKGRRVYRGGRRLSHRLGEEIRDGMADVSEGYHYARERVEDAVEDYPIAVGAAALAAGMLLGALIPRSRYEDEWMGEASDEFKEAAKDFGEEAAGRAREVATHTAEAAMQEAEAQGLAPDQLGEKLKNVASKLGDAAKETSQEEGLSPAELKEKATQVAKEAKTTVREESKKAAESLKESARHHE